MNWTKAHLLARPAATVQASAPDCPQGGMEMDFAVFGSTRHGLLPPIGSMGQTQGHDRLSASRGRRQGAEISDGHGVHRLKLEGVKLSPEGEVNRARVRRRSST